MIRVGSYKEERGGSRPPSPRRPARLLPRRLRRARPRGRAGRASSPTSSRSTPPASTSTGRSSAASSRPASYWLCASSWTRASRLADAAAASRPPRSSRGRTQAPSPREERRAVPQRSSLPLLVRTAEGVRRLRLGGRVRSTAPTASSRRSLFGERRARTTAVGAARRPLARRARSSSADGIRVHAAATGRARRRAGRRRRTAAAPTSGSGDRTGCACSSSSGELRRATQDTPPGRAGGARRTPSRRSGSPPPLRPPPGRSSSNGSTGTRSGSGRCCGIAATEPGAASRPGSTRGAARLAGELRRAARAGGGRLASSREALERWELSLFEDEPLPRPSGCASRSTALLGGVDGPWAAGDARLGAARRDRAASGPASSSGFGRSPAASGRDAEVADALRRAIVETLLHEDRGRLLVCARRRAARAPRRATRGLFRGTCNSPLFRHSGVTLLATVTAWRRRAACSHGWSGSRRSSATVPCPAFSSPSCVRSCDEAEAWARAERTVPDAAADAVEQCRQMLAGHEQDSASLSRKTARHNGGRTGHRAPACPGVDL